jgi:anaphase-promoting complex subunit 10
MSTDSPVGQSSSAQSANVYQAQAVAEIPREHREIGDLAVWSVTSAKPGNGVELLRDGQVDTYWQSDGVQPHLVSIQFQKNAHIVEVGLYLDYKSDESYTPSKLSIRAGTGYHDLKEVRVVEIEEPKGWVLVPLRGSEGEPLRAFLLQVAVISNHQNGRDTHIRLIRVLGPRQDPLSALNVHFLSQDSAFLPYSTIR